VVRERACEGLTAVLGRAGDVKWRAVAANYRLLIYASGEEQGVAENGAATKAGISAEKVAEVVRERGELPCSRCCAAACATSVVAWRSAVGPSCWEPGVQGLRE
jgi:hypothetical protein